MGLSSSSKEINVTPLIDVLLVLLVIFLVVMPVMMRMETVDVPRESRDVDPVPSTIVSIHADLSFAIDDGPTLPAPDLTAKLAALQPKVVFLAVDDAVPWNAVIATVDSVRGATQASVALKTK